VPC
jgi:hypothetical protein